MTMTAGTAQVELIHAELVYDGGQEIHVPARLGQPTANQLRGTAVEQLAELAGRVCYDSLGSEKSRDSAAYHKHILEVGHLSVYEHCVFTVEVWPLDSEKIDMIYTLLNRPGVLVKPGDGILRVTFNLRAILEFDAWQGFAGPTALQRTKSILLDAVGKHVSQVCTPSESGSYLYSRAVHPTDDDEKWVSMLMTGSRGMSHELVRHGDWTAISQRSTRYVDESESPWVEHPLTHAYLVSGDAGYSPEADSAVVAVAQRQYRNTVEALEEWLLSRRVDKQTARKQARGAARGYLGNALYTELIFSASVAQWKRMLTQRCSDAADAEIRILFAKALMELKRSRYADCFVGMNLTRAKDGIGAVLA